MKILFIVPYVPNLVRVRPYNLIRYLVRQGHSVTLATLYSTNQEKNELEHLKNIVDQIIALPLPVSRSFLNVAQAVLSRDPLQTAYCWNPQLQHLIHHQLTDAKIPFDVVHIEHLRGVRYGLAIKEVARKMKTPLIWDSVDNITYLFKQSSVQSKRLINRWITRFELGRTARFETWVVDQFERVLVTSPNDRQAFIELNPSQKSQERIKVLPNGVDLEYFTPDAQIMRRPDTLVVTGKMSYHANVTMVMSFVQDILPLVWQSKPDVRLQIVGKDPPTQLQALNKDPRIEVTGTVPDVRPYLRQATIAVAPVPYGAGIQNKVLEAMACATPVISSSQAIAALTVEPDTEILVSDQPEVFAQKIVNLLDDSQLRTQIGKGGLEYVRRCHNWNSIVSDLVETYHVSNTSLKMRNF